MLAAGLLALAATLPAHALTTSVVPLGDLSNVAVGFPRFTSSTGDYLDVYEFTVIGPGVGFGGAVNTPFDDPLFAGVETNFDIVAVAFLDSLNAVIAEDLDGTDGFAVGAALPAAGLYSFAVLGTANGTINGAYFTQIQTVIPTVSIPEPEAALLMLTGLGSLAWALRRRQTTGRRVRVAL